MTEVIITAEYLLHDTLVSLGKFKTEQKAWDALEVEGLRLKRTSENPVDIEREFEDTCRVVLTCKEKKDGES
jgi:hypothetical protein